MGGQEGRKGVKMNILKDLNNLRNITPPGTEIEKTLKENN